MCWQSGGGGGTDFTCKTFSKFFALSSWFGTTNAEIRIPSAEDIKGSSSKHGVS